MHAIACQSIEVRFHLLPCRYLPLSGIAFKWLNFKSKVGLAKKTGAQEAPIAREAR
jgi:hypothetical protein